VDFLTPRVTATTDYANLAPSRQILQILHGHFLARFCAVKCLRSVSFVGSAMTDSCYNLVEFTQGFRSYGVISHEKEKKRIQDIGRGT